MEKLSGDAPPRRRIKASLCGQNLDFLHRLMRRIISRDSFPEESDCNALLGFDFTKVQLQSVLQFLEKIEFRTKAMKAANGRINVQREKNKRAKANTIATGVLGDMFHPHVDQRRAYTRYVCPELRKYPTFELYLLWVGLFRQLRTVYNA